MKSQSTNSPNLLRGTRISSTLNLSQLGPKGHSLMRTFDNGRRCMQVTGWDGFGENPPNNVHVLP